MPPLYQKKNTKSGLFRAEKCKKGRKQENQNVDDRMISDKAVRIF